METSYNVTQVSPEMAEAFLLRNPKNRSVNLNRVLDYANQMKCGLWVFNGAPIVFDINEVLLDGQHRLYAVCEAKVTIPFLIVSGADPKVIETIDTGRARSAGDLLHMQDVKNFNIVAAAASFLWRMWWDIDHRTFCSNENTLGIVKRFPKLVTWSSHVGGKPATIPPSLFAATLVYFDEIAQNSSLANKLLFGLTKGEGLAAGDPILHLRNRCLVERTKGSKYTSLDYWALLLSAIDALEEGKDITKLFPRERKTPVGQPKLFLQHVGALPKIKTLQNIVPPKRAGGGTSKNFKELVQEHRETSRQNLIGA